MCRSQGDIKGNILRTAVQIRKYTVKIA